MAMKYTRGDAIDALIADPAHYAKEERVAFDITDTKNIAAKIELLLEELRGEQGRSYKSKVEPMGEKPMQWRAVVWYFRSGERGPKALDKLKLDTELEGLRVVLRWVESELEKAKLSWKEVEIPESNFRRALASVRRRDNTDGITIRGSHWI
jgi:hypothetical protein